MCGRFAFFLPPADLKRLFGCDNLINFPARYNAAPMQDHPVVIRGRMGLARWGFLPPWADGDDRAAAAKMINARVETIAEKPSFRDAWKAGRRCLVPANGFYEWYGAGKETVPHYIHRAGGGMMAMAGLWARVGDLVVFTILTREATDPIRRFHHRMPVIFDPAQAESWFAATPEQAAVMAGNAVVGDMAFHEVGRAVGRVANDTPDLIAPVIHKITSGGLF